MSFSGVKISYLSAKSHLIFHWCLCNNIFYIFQLYGAKVVGLGVGAGNSINLDAFEVLTGRKDRYFFLQFKKSVTCDGDDSESEDEDESEDDSDSDDDGGCVNSELKTVVDLICN